MFAALNIDRGNISNAVSDNMLDDLGLTQGDYVCSDNSSIGLLIYLRLSEYRQDHRASGFPRRRAAISDPLQAVSHLSLNMYK